MRYMSANGHNQHTLTAIDPQPRCLGIQFAERVYGVGGTATDKGKGFLEFEYAILTVAQYRTLLTRFGLAGNLLSRIESANVSLLVLTDERYPQFVNGIIDLPRIGPENKYRMGHYNDVTFLVRHVEAMS